MINIDKLNAAMDMAAMPADFKWRSFMMHLAGMATYDFLTGEQKKQLKALFDQILGERNYSEEYFRTIFMRKQSILAAPWKTELKLALDEAMGRVHSFKKLLRQRTDDIRDLEEETVRTVETETSLDAVVASVKSGFGGLISKLEDDAKVLVEMSMTDVLTGLPNRRAFDLAIQRSFKRWKDKGGKLALIMIDIDYFKAFNDKYGHRIGDQVLATVGAAVKQACGPRDVTTERSILGARFGGEEFAVLLVGFAAQEVKDLAKELCQRVARYNFVIRDANGRIIENHIQLTISAGSAMAEPGWDSPARLIDAADSLLYRAKRSGRNQVCSQPR
ncbi:GGDEF domain-containing protein [Desulfoplanes formicivorans]|uniref:diguanylate cyclase n=1 Tax=Desulfoplanes formicivorans TaxID=1592317 RepID=A0A194AHN4_9BACT|nr:GGDEF domain-containing protein [Desulfoplanes formicivorans]GAU09592.1 diguanylate cyclase [Desulfoplanes formicivorans]